MFTAFRTGWQASPALTPSIRACRYQHQTLRGLAYLEGVSLCGLWSSASARRTVHGGDDGTAGRLSASGRPDEAFDDVQGLRKGCPAACRSILQRWSGQVAGIWQASQEQTTAEDRVWRQEFLS
jgi:hypothetical protein